jgi:hypothetical protein
LPPVLLLPGQAPAQEARWAAVGKRLMSVPISATITWRGLVPERRVHRLGGDPGRSGDARDRRAAVPLVDEQRLRGGQARSPDTSG